MDRYLIRAAEVAAIEGEERTHFLNPQARRINRSLGDLTGLTGLGFHVIEVAPGDVTTEYHVHHFEDECVYVLAGTGTAEIGDEEHEIGPGDFLGYRAGGLAHAIRNTGSDVLRCIVVGQRLAHDVGDYPRHNKRIYRNGDMPWDLVDKGEIENP